MIILLLANDFIYMCIHRILHQVPFLYKFHKVHHEYDTVFSALGQYAHPVEEVLGNLVIICLFRSLDPQCLPSIRFTFSLFSSTRSTSYTIAQKDTVDMIYHGRQQEPSPLSTLPITTTSIILKTSVIMQPVFIFLRLSSEPTKHFSISSQQRIIKRLHYRKSQRTKSNRDETTHLILIHSFQSRIELI